MNRPRYKAPASHEIVDRQFFIKDQYDKIVVNDDGEELIGALVDEHSITKRHLGKVAYGAELGIGVEQLLYPDIGAAVEHTGKFWRNPYKRVAVSMEPIMAVVYAEDPWAAGLYVQRLHQGISGTDPSGRKFNALQPEAFYWAHETFRSGVERTVEHYSRESLSNEDREQLQLESALWYSYYGMPMKMAPANYKANEVYRQRMIDDVLMMNPSAERAIDAALNRNPPRPESIPAPVWKLARLAVAPITEVVSLATIGELDPAIRHKFGIPFSAADQKHLDEFRTVAKTFIDPMPDPLRYSPQSYDSLLRDRQGEHKSATDRLLYNGMKLGTVALERTAERALPVVERAKNISSRLTKYASIARAA